MNYKHLLMFVAGFLLQDIREAIKLLSKRLTRKLFGHKSFNQQAPLLYKLKEELSELERKND